MTYLQHLLDTDKDQLVNDLYNRAVADLADYESGETDPHGHGKRIPYIGWFWRDCDFVHRCIAIGDSGAFTGVMESNKWGYPERAMTPEEAETFIGYLERAFAARNRGGNVADAHAAAEVIFGELWDWFQTLKVEA